MTPPKPSDQIERAQRDVELAKKRLASTMGALQYRLKPGVLMNNAWDGVREKSGEAADGALLAVKKRPAAASGVIAAILLFLAREPLGRLISELFGRTAEEEGRVTADLDNVDGNFDLTAPTVDNRSLNEGVSA
jgi:hypothetical protein